MFFSCVDDRDDCVNNSLRGCYALSDVSWIKDGKCPFYISPEQHKKDLELIGRRKVENELKRKRKKR